jgi:hypothetical protein
MGDKKNPTDTRTVSAKLAGTVRKSRLRARIERKRQETLQDDSLPEIPDSRLKEALADVLEAGISRRDVLKVGAVAAGAAAMPGAALALGAGRKRGQKGGAREFRSYVFDLSWCDTDGYDVVLAAHPHYHKLTRTSPGKLRQLRSKHPVLERIPDENLTHYIEVDMPADSVQWCYLQRFRRGVKDGTWDMLMMFIHHPVSALVAAAEKERGLLGLGAFPKVANKWEKYGLTGQDVALLDEPIGLDTFKDSCDTACTMISGHPEMMCLDATNSAYIQNTITSQNSGNLGEIIEFQGPAQPQQNWVDCSTPFQANSSGYATLVPLCNPDTGEQQVNSQTGALQYMPEYSDTTSDSLNSDGLQPSLTSAKQDTTLGGNITTEPDGTEGYIWRTQDGVTTSVQEATAPGADTGFSYQTKDFSPGHGYSVEVTSVNDSPTETSLEAVVNIEVKNWYVRFLGLFVRYLDSNGDVIPTDQIAAELGDQTMQKYFSFWNEGFDTSKEVFLAVLFPEFELFGIPTQETKKNFNIPVPKSATSIVILAGGLGTGNNSNPYAETVGCGVVMTSVISLGLTFFFLTLQASAAYAPFSESLEEPSNLKPLLPIIIEGFADLTLALNYDNPGAFKGLGVKVGNALVKASIKPLVTFMAPFIAEAEEEDAILDAIPFVGAAYSAIQAIGTLAQLAQTSVEVATSPATYAYEVTLTHDIEVTVRPNLSPPPDGDPDGWPATATHYDVIAMFDGGTPTTIRGDLPPTQTTDPQTVTFRNVPLGGQVTMSVGVYSDTDFLVGQASAETQDNQEGVSFDITFKEILVPLDATTEYSHKEVIELDSSGNHLWVASATPPAQALPGCSPSQGQLCSLTGITVNSATGDVGQNFQSYNSAVPTCTNPNSRANAHQFSNISSGQDPESEFFFSGCTFSSSPRLAYDLLNRNSMNFYLDTASRGPNYQGVIRQVRLDKDDNPGFDGPDSNRAWGKLQHPSDSLLLHPGGKIISIANTQNKFEVIDLPDSVQTDADAPFSQTYSAPGLRPGLLQGPVHAALDPDGTILVLEDGNKRIQAFDLNGNAAPIFPGGAYFVPLKEQPVTRYLDFAVEFKGYMYVLSVYSGGGNDLYTLDIYQPTGEWLAATTGFDAQRLAVNYWRDIYAQNSQVLKLPDGSLPARTEPSISHWIPSTP